MSSDDTLTDDDLARLEALAAGAAAGPWEALPTRHERDGFTLTFSDEAEVLPPFGEAGPVAACSQTEHDNAAFIADARTALPAAVAEIRRLRPIAAAARAFIAGHATDPHDLHGQVERIGALVAALAAAGEERE